MHGLRRNIVIALSCGLAATVALGQTSTVEPDSPVAIENTNASFSVTDVTVPQANPSRPTVTFPAHVPPTGYLQFEQGFNQAGSSPQGTAGQSSLSQTTKIAVTTRVMVQFITQPFAYSTVTTPTGAVTQSADPGDLLVGLQGIVHKSIGVMPTIDVGYIRRVGAGSSANLDSGGYSQSALLLFGGDLPGGFHYDSNVLFDEQNDGAVRRPQFGQTLAVSHPMFAAATQHNLTGYVELSHFTQPFVMSTTSGVAATRANTADLLFAAAYAVRPNIVVDVAYSRGLTTTSTENQGTFGVTYLLPHRLWADRHPRVIRVGHVRP